MIPQILFHGTTALRWELILRDGEKVPRRVASGIDIS
jgi:hypothetical protein